MEEATVKGQLLLGAKRYIRDKFGAAGYNKFMQNQTPEDRVLWEEKPMLPVSRVPVRLFIGLYETFVKIWSEKAFAVAAAEVAFYDLNSIMKLFMKMGSPSFVGSRFPKIWHQYFNQGEMKIIKQDEHSLTLQLLNAETYGKGGCEGAVGWTGKALEFSGAKNLKVSQTQCGFKGASHCVIEYSWE